MSFELLKKTVQAEKNLDLNSARILILISHLNGKNVEKSINGIEKLAKFDFLVRFPTVLERTIGNPSVNLNIKEYERKSIGSDLAKFSYKPWDRLYRQCLAILDAKKLVKIDINEKHRVLVKITEKGIELAERLGSMSEFSDIVKRSKIVKSYYRSASNVRLSQLVEGALPSKKVMILGELTNR